MTLALRPSHVEPIALTDVARRTGARLDGADVLVTGATVDSRDVERGDLFGALPGFASHGARFAAQAVAAGAAAILTDDEGLVLVRGAGLDVPVLVAEQPRRAIALAACAVYRDPSHRLTLIGVTGTNGKTTTSFLIEAALRRLGAPTTLLGTIEMRVGDESRAAERTTVEAPLLQRLLARSLELGVKLAVTEASSQAIHLERTAGTRFAVAVFTNLSHDHLDYHHTMEEYYLQKRRLFEEGASEVGLVLVDDEWGERLAREARVPVVTLATRPGGRAVDWAVTAEERDAEGGMRFTIRDPQGVLHDASTRLPGHINVSNASTAIVAAVLAGIPVAEAIDAVATARAVPGRTEIITARSATTPLVVADYAHTPDGVASVLQAMRGVTPGKLIVVFGCDGLRDDSKRPGLGRAAAQNADIVFVTDENPKTEPADFIRARLMEGVVEVRPGLDDVYEVAPRADAVRAAMEMAGPLDTVITTGKGHETTQEINGVHYPYTDRGVVQQWYAERDGASS